MSKLQHCLVLFTALLALMAPQTSSAQIWRNTPFDPGTWRFPPPPPPSVSTFDDPVSTRFTLVNRTSWSITYWINGFPKPQIQANQPPVTWLFNGSTNNYPQMHISIDTGIGRRAEYNLQDGHVYYFELSPNGGIDLYTN